MYTSQAEVIFIIGGVKGGEKMTRQQSSKYFYSNCLTQAIKHKANNPNKIKIIKRGSWWGLFRLKLPHFCWTESGRVYHFRAEDRNLSFFQQLRFKGSIEEFLLGHDDLPYDEIRERKYCPKCENKDCMPAGEENYWVCDACETVFIVYVK